MSIRFSVALAMAALIGMSGGALASLNVTSPSAEQSWYAGGDNVFAWNNASFIDPPGRRSSYSIPSPFRFNFTLFPCNTCGAPYSSFEADDYGPFVGESGAVRVHLSSRASPGTYRLQADFYDAPSSTVVVIGSSDNFTIAAPLSSQVFSPVSEYPKSNQAVNSWGPSPLIAIAFTFALAIMLTSP